LEKDGYKLPLSQSDIEKITLSNGPFIRPEQTELDELLADVKVIGGLTPAVVIRVEEQLMLVRTLDYGELTIEWDGLDWARSYINDETQGPEPETANDIVQEGQLIYVRQRPEDKVWQLSQFPVATGAFVAVNPFDGGVNAVVGGYSFFNSQFNRATQAKRQVGSNIKPFIYASAIDNGYTLASVINDAPINQWDASSGVAWRPQNSPAIYDGPIRMRVALGKSKNVVSVRLLRGVGLEVARDYLSQFGFERSEIPLDETMSLGSGAHTPLEVATALAVIENGGFAVEPYFIERIENSAGEIIWQAQPLYACDPCEDFDRNGQKNDTATNELGSEVLNEVLGEVDIEAMLANQLKEEAESEGGEISQAPMQTAPRVMSEQTAFLVAEMMRTAVRANGRNENYWIGTGWRARSILQRTDIGGKTGTTNDSRDAWFSGFAPNLVATSWVGFDDNVRQLGRVSRNQLLINKNPSRFNYIGNTLIGVEDGAKAAQPVWIRFMQEVLKDVPQTIKAIPSDIVRVRIDRETGLLTQRTDNTSVFEYFKKGTEPTTFAPQNSYDLPVDGEDSEQETDETLLDELF
jgi:penicillin-binding protein 1A